MKYLGYLLMLVLSPLVLVVVAFLLLFGAIRGNGDD